MRHNGKIWRISLRGGSSGGYRKATLCRTRDNPIAENFSGRVQCRRRVLPPTFYFIVAISQTSEKNFWRPNINTISCRVVIEFRLFPFFSFFLSFSSFCRGRRLIAVVFGWVGWPLSIRPTSFVLSTLVCRLDNMFKTLSGNQAVCEGGWRGRSSLVVTWRFGIRASSYPSTVSANTRT